MKTFLAKLDLTAIAYVAAMAVLLSTMVFLLAPQLASAVTQEENGTMGTYGNEFDRFNQNGAVGWSDGNYSVDIDNLFDFFQTGNTLSNNRDLLRELLALLQRLEDIKKKLAELRGDNGPTLGRQPWCSAGVWTRDLSLGDEGEDVRILQKFLNAQGFKIAESGPGSPGQESTFFGHGTERTLIKFQEQHKDHVLTPIGETRGTGYFGATTQRYIVSLCKTTGVATTFTLRDVQKVTKKFVDPSPLMADEEYTLYTITLKSGKVVEVKVFGNTTTAMVREAFNKAGYTGDVDDLMDMATEEAVPNFGLSDVKHVGVQATSANGVEYRHYSIELKNGKVHKVVTNSNMSSTQRRNAFRAVGYTGDIDDLIDMADEISGLPYEPDTSYDIDDIKTAARLYVDPSPLMADEEYYIYTVTLKNGSVIQFMVAAFSVVGHFEEVLRKSGYTGDVDDFTDLVVNVDQTITSKDLFPLTVVVEGRKVHAMFDLSDGCKGYAINWGDGATDNLAHSSGDVCTQVYRMMDIEHTYQRGATYTITVTITSGGSPLTATQKVTIK